MAVPLKRCEQPVWLGVELDRCASPRGKETGLGCIADVVAEPQPGLDPVDRAAKGESPRLDHAEPFLQKTVWYPKVKVGILFAEVGNRHGLDLIQGHQLIMAGCAPFALLVDIPGRIGKGKSYIWYSMFLTLINSFT